MGLGVSILLIAAGAILAFAVNTTVSGVDIQTVGWILLIVGIIGAVLSMIFWSTLGRPRLLGRTPPRRLRRRSTPARLLDRTNAGVSRSGREAASAFGSTAAGDTPRMTAAGSKEGRALQVLTRVVSDSPFRARELIDRVCAGTRRPSASSASTGFRPTGSCRWPSRASRHPTRQISRCCRRWAKQPRPWPRRRVTSAMPTGSSTTSSRSPLTSCGRRSRSSTGSRRP